LRDLPATAQEYPMMMTEIRRAPWLLLVALCAACTAQPIPANAGPLPSPSPLTSEPLTLRVAAFNVEDIRTEDLLRADQPRLKRIAEILQRIRPNIVLISEIAYDLPGGPDVKSGDEPGQNARRFVEQYLSVSQGDGLKPLAYDVFMAPTNTGMPSGFDLDNDGTVTGSFPPPPRTRASGAPGPQTDGGRAYGNDCWGFGTFPGQYAFALLVDPRLTIDRDGARTFRLMPWDYMPGAALPTMPATGEPWFTDEERAIFRLSSKSHWDVPVRLPNGSVLHLLCSHPTPPAFDAEEQRNARRNYDEIRFWADYVEGARYMVDDQNREGPLARGELFVILGDLNCDAREGTPFKNGVELLLRSPRLAPDPAPRSEIEVKDLDDTDTAFWGKRADYVLPSKGLRVSETGVWRHPPAGGGAFPSDHFPVWADLVVPPLPADAR
jgi:hypothetical protein